MFNLADDIGESSLLDLSTPAVAAALTEIRAALVRKNNRLPFPSLNLNLPVPSLSWQTIGDFETQPYICFLSRFYIKTIFLPRQARDKHRENSKNVCCLTLVCAPQAAHQIVVPESNRTCPSPTLPYASCSDFPAAAHASAAEPGHLWALIRFQFVAL